ncbi:unnamed protein product [Bursaphelenchus xylophilus]|uniref:Hexosyltransferase n=1 Tax=Bursaphelenchus xylophilus TaxID=6326 RepID=A0A1I7S6K3_BURXY|nr:unnamed protein product [Bursaphelenchus xylophilus]CAG9120514.1 unnamed protein product [Bursaphelenchus xylophilus]
MKFAQFLPACLVLAIIGRLIFKLVVIKTPCRKNVDFQWNRVLFLNDSDVSNVDFTRDSIEWPEDTILPIDKCNVERLYVIVVHSAIGNADRRNRLRGIIESLEGERPHLIFSIGRTRNTTLQNEVENESKIFKDLLQTHSLDDYRLLPSKAHSWIRFLSQNCTNKIKFVLKIDDDVNVNFNLFKEFLETRETRKQQVLCSPFKHIADRRKKSTWYLSEKEFRHRNLGYFCAGLAYIISADLLPNMLRNSAYRRVVWLDDWYVTHSLLVGETVKIYDISSLYFVSETIQDAYRQLSQIKMGLRPIPMFSHLRPRKFFDQQRQSYLWEQSQQCLLQLDEDDELLESEAEQARKASTLNNIFIVQ